MTNLGNLVHELQEEALNESINQEDDPNVDAFEELENMIRSQKCHELL